MIVNRKSVNLFKRYAVATSGAFAIWGAIGAPVLIGSAALSVDASRLYNMDQDLQSAADALSRAGAAELDQRGDSLQRAARAIQNLVKNDQKFAKAGGGAVAIDSIRYLKSIPDNDFDHVSSDQLTQNPSEARYVEVNVKPETISTLFPPSMVKGLVDVTLSAKSVAGMSQSVCGVAPVFICNPMEGAEQSLYDAMGDPAFLRRQIKFKIPSGKKAQYGPGNFGYLDPFNGQGGASAIADAIAVDIPPVCMSKSAGVYLRPGNIASMRFGINTRFDIYKGAFKKKRTDPAYAPAENVVKGYVGKTCKTSPSSSAYGLPRDDCFATGQCTDASGRMGDGQWDFVNYMKVNHSTINPITINNTSYRFNYKKHKSYPSTPPSRYDMYRWEIDNFCVPGAATYGKHAGTPEEGTPQCHSSGPSTTVEDRRIIHAAVLNCGAIEESGESMAGRTDALPVETFVKVFLTEPMGSGKDNVLYGEIVGPVLQGADSVARDKVAVTR